MRAMKDSGIPWIGEIPENWEVKRLKQESIFINGFAFDSEDFKIDEGVRVIRIGDIGLKADFENCVRAITNSSILKPYRIEDGDILIAMSGATTGKCCIVDKSEEAYINQRVGIIRSDIRKIIYYSLQTPYFMEFVNLNNAGSAQPNISSKAIGEFPILSIPTTEQQKIAEFLDRKCAEVDEMIGLQEQIIEELKSYKQSVITEAVTKGLNPAAPMRDSGIEWIGQIPEHWSKDKIIRSFRMIGSGTTPKSTDENNFDGDINWIQSGDINGGVMESCKNRVSYETVENCSALKVYSAPFIIVAMYGASVGNTSISSIDGCVNQACCVLSDSALNFNYAFSVIKSCKDYWLRKAVGGGQPNISQETIKQTWIPIPPITEQQAIADYLDEKCADIDSLIQTKQSKIDSLKEYKKSIIYEYVTGKREVE